MDDRIHRINENLQVGGIIRLDITQYDHFSTVGTVILQGSHTAFCEWDRDHKDVEKCIILGNLI